VKGVCRVAAGLLVLAGAALPASSRNAAPAAPATAHDPRHDFDFDLGSWHTHSRRLLQPLTGSMTWVDWRAPRW